MSRVRVSLAAPIFLSFIVDVFSIEQRSYQDYVKNAPRCPGGGIGRHKGFKIPRL